MEQRFASLLTEVGEPEQHRLALQLTALAADMEVTGKQRDDPIRELPARIGDRWSTLLLLLLRIGPFRHATLRRLVAEISAEGRISQRMLTLRLRGLEREGLVARSIIEAVPVKVEYSITPLGLGLLKQIDALLGWLTKHDAEIRDARRRFDELREEGDFF